MASPVCRCAASCSATFAQWTAGASRHPAFPAPSALSRANTAAKLGHDVPRGREACPRYQCQSEDAACHALLAGGLPERCVQCGTWTQKAPEVAARNRSNDQKQCFCLLA
ncbi:hypothetical protein XH86_20170 [Bradyrhizobium guangdongense]|uniref:Uncharacterized protein n=1 Tax=Bradyrhizobium guangdongense TaxID=1325090 RepID=A0ABX6UHI1_9BRAD|nr:hypothetical protein X265_20145 [Bradyrhizobium guangdongense]QOZ60781.1 hypothetical protein XH86_20170 [Bradyrhizobium guangdongense]